MILTGSRGFEPLHLQIKKMINKISVKCEGCGKSFDRITAEVNRSKKLGRKIYCSLACSGKAVFSTIELIAENLQSDNRKDEYSPFRFLFNTAKRHAQEKGRPFELTLKYMKNL
jgi:hypothetical protein